MTQDDIDALRGMIEESIDEDVSDDHRSKMYGYIADRMCADNGAVGLEILDAAERDLKAREAKPFASIFRRRG